MVKRYWPPVINFATQENKMAVEQQPNFLQGTKGYQFSVINICFIKANKDLKKFFDGNGKVNGQYGRSLNVFLSGSLKFCQVFSVFKFFPVLQVAVMTITVSISWQNL